MKSREQALTALRVFKQRGEEAAAHLEDAGADDTFFRLMQKRDAAFANFRALDEVARRAGCDLALDPVAQNLYREIKSSHRLLAQLFQTALDQVVRERRSLQVGGEALAAYHGGSPNTGWLRRQG